MFCFIHCTSRDGGGATAGRQLSFLMLTLPCVRFNIYSVEFVLNLNMHCLAVDAN